MSAPSGRMAGSAIANRFRVLATGALSARLPLSLLIPAALVLWFSVPTLASLNAIWLTDADYTHGHLAVFLAVLLAVREFRAIFISPVPNRAGVACLLLIAALVIVGHASSTVLIAQFALPSLWIAAVWALAGAPFARRLALPLSYIYFAIPIWNLLIEPLRTLTIIVVTAWTRVAGLPAFIEGNFVHVPSGTFEVEGGCAGLRYLLVATALVGFRCLLERRSWRAWASLTLSAVGLALVGNWIRVFATVAAGMSPEWWILQMVRDHHTLFGWMLFIVFMIPLFFLDRGLQSGSDAPIEPGSEASPAARSPAEVTWVVCLVLAFGIWIGQRIDGVAPLSDTVVAFAPPDVAGWDAPVEWKDARTPAFVGASARTAGWYVNGRARIGAYVAHYSSQSQEHEVVFAHNRPEGQAVVAAKGNAVAVATGSGLIVPFREFEVVDSAAERRLVWVGLRVAGNPAAGKLDAKILQVKGAIRGRYDAQALVLTARCDGDCQDAHMSLETFASAGADSLFDGAERALRTR